MKVQVTFEANDVFRRALRYSLAGTGKATREELIAHFSAYGVAKVPAISSAFRAHLRTLLEQGDDEQVAEALAGEREPAEGVQS